MTMTSQRRKLYTLIIGVALTALAVALSAVSFQRKVDTFQTLGFDARPRAGGVQVMEVEDRGTALEPGDRILLVNGQFDVFFAVLALANGLLYLAAGTWLFRKMEARAKQRGMVGHY